LKPDKYKLNIENGIIIDYQIIKNRLEKIIKSKENIIFAEKCGICFESRSELQINCGHTFCKSCLSIHMNKFNNKNCPYCRQKIKECYC